jgi:hypothetical protein
MFGKSIAASFDGFKKTTDGEGADMYLEEMCGVLQNDPSIGKWVGDDKSKNNYAFLKGILPNIDKNQFKEQLNRRFLIPANICKCVATSKNEGKEGGINTIIYNKNKDLFDIMKKHITFVMNDSVSGNQLKRAWDELSKKQIVTTFKNKQYGLGVDKGTDVSISGAEAIRYARLDDVTDPVCKQNFLNVFTEGNNFDVKLLGVFSHDGKIYQETTWNKALVPVLIYQAYDENYNKKWYLGCKVISEEIFEKVQEINRLVNSNIYKDEFEAKAKEFQAKADTIISMIQR